MRIAAGSADQVEREMRESAAERGLDVQAIDVGDRGHSWGAPRVGQEYAVSGDRGWMLDITAVAHFSSLRPDMVAMVPPFVPNPEFMVTFTGICEILGAIGLLVPRTRRIAAAALIVFLLAVLPASIHAAQAGVTLRGAPPTPIVPRIALQALFIALLWWSGIRAPR